MIKKLTLALFVFLGLYSTAYSQDTNIKKFEGIWIGTYEGNGQTHTASLMFKEVNGKLTGMAESTEKPDGEPMVVENITVTGNTLKFEIMSVIKYEGILKEDKKMIEGILLGMDGQSVKLNMTLKEVPAAVNNDKFFVGTWKGTTGEAGDEKTIIFVVSEKDGKLSGTIEVVESSTGQVEVENLTIKESKIKFEITMANVSYDGVLKADKKIIEGIAKENEKAFPLNLVKDEKAPVK